MWWEAEEIRDHFKGHTTSAEYAEELSASGRVHEGHASSLKLLEHKEAAPWVWGNRKA